MFLLARRIVHRPGVLGLLSRALRTNLLPLLIQDLLDVFEELLGMVLFNASNSRRSRRSSHSGVSISMKSYDVLSIEVETLCDRSLLET